MRKKKKKHGLHISKTKEIGDYPSRQTLLGWICCYPKEHIIRSEMKKVFIHSWTIKPDLSSLDLDGQRLKTMIV
jgi:hypothetical protein